MILAGTGHRPQRLGGYSETVNNKLRKLITKELEKLRPNRVISGMALGFDMALAEAAINLDIMVVAAVPFEGQEEKWPERSQERYHNILKNCETIEYCSPPGYTPYKLQFRNRWMVDNCDALLALWDGGNGGTCNCVRYAEEYNKRIINLWDKWS